jgi:hypothetical protein
VWEERSYAMWTASVFFLLLAGVATRTDFRSIMFYVVSFLSPPHMLGLLIHAVISVQFDDVLAERKVVLLPGACA